MKPIDVKIFLLRRGLSIQAVANHLATETCHAASTRTMLTQMIHGHAYYPTLAKRLREEYGIAIPPPAKRAQLKRAA